MFRDQLVLLTSAASFGVHTFRLSDSAGHTVLVKFH